MILVTGGAGFIGSHLVLRLLRDNLGPVRVLDNLSRAVCHETVAGAAVDFMEGDIRDACTVEAAMQDVDVVYHLAAKSSVIGAATDIQESFSTNVAGTLTLLQAAARQNVRRFVFTSSREVYGEVKETPVRETAPLLPKNAYGASKASAEMYCQIFANQGLDVRVLRFSNVYGPGDRDRVLPIFAENALNGRPLTLFGGQQVVDFVAVEFAVEALVRSAIGRWGNCPVDGPVNIGSGTGTTVAEACQKVIRATGSRSAVEIRPSREIEVSRFVADTARAAEWLGLRPNGNSLDRLEELVDWTRGRMALATAAG